MPKHSKSLRVINVLITAVDAPENMASATHREHPQKSLAVLLKIRLFEPLAVGRGRQQGGEL